jgi:hypothetical protein
VCVCVCVWVCGKSFPFLITPQESRLPGCGNELSPPVKSNVKVKYGMVLDATNERRNIRFGLLIRCPGWRSGILRTFVIFAEWVYGLAPRFSFFPGRSLFSCSSTRRRLALMEI